MFHHRYVTRNFIFHTFQHSFAHCRIGIAAQRQAPSLPKHQRKPSCELMERPKAHLHARRNISAMITSGGIYKFISNASPGIYNQNILAGKLFVCTHHSRHPVISQGFGRFVKILHRKQCFFI